MSHCLKPSLIHGKRLSFGVVLGVGAVVMVVMEKSQNGMKI